VGDVRSKSTPYIAITNVPASFLALVRTCSTYIILLQLLRDEKRIKIEDILVSEIVSSSEAD